MCSCPHEDKFLKNVCMNNRNADKDTSGSIRLHHATPLGTREHERERRDDDSEVEDKKQSVHYNSDVLPIPLYLLQPVSLFFLVHQENFNLLE